MRIVTGRVRVVRAVTASKTKLVVGLLLVLGLLGARGALIARADVVTGLTAYYSFDDISGSTVNDSSGNGYNGMLNGTTIATGFIGNAAQFDGINDDIDISQQLVSGQTPELTYSFFVKIDAAADDKNYLLAQASSGTNNNDCFSVSYDNVAKQLKALHSNNGLSPAQTISSVDLSKWTHVAVTNSSANDQSRVYINGVLVLSRSVSCSQELGAQFLIGRSPWAAYDQYLKGELDEVRVYSRVLSSADIYELGTQTATNNLSITNLTDGAQVNGTVSIQATASGSPSLSSVQFYVNGVAAGAVDVSAPYSYDWDTTTLLQGDYAVSALGTDSNGDAVIAQSFVVEVDNPPSYSLIGAKAIMNTTADIVWTTDEPTTGVVDYGLTTGYGSQAATSSELSYYHKISISNLSPGSTYNFKITATDKDSNQTESSNQTFATISNVSGNQWHVTTDGTSSGDGSLEDPWDLSTALDHPGAVEAGDTIWVHEGTYDGPFTTDLTGTAALPITVRNYDNKRVIIDGGSSNSSVVTVNGAYSWFWGLEIINSDTTRVIAEAGSNPVSLTRGQGFYVEAPGSRLINNIIHDTAQGIGFWTPAVNAEAYGNIIYYNGWDGPDRGHGHGIYSQNNTGVKNIEANQVFKNFDFGLHNYTQSGTINNFVINQNTFYDAGQLSASGLTQNMLVGGYAVAKNSIVLNNNTYMPHAYGEGLNIGYVAGCDNATAMGNYLASSNAFSYSASCTRTTVSGNTFYGGVPGGTSTAYPDNSYYNSTAPTNNYTNLTVNRYEPTKAYLTVFNWQDLDNISLDVDSLLTENDIYAVYDNQNYFGTAVATGTYDGTSISVPMTGTTVASAVGNVPVSPSHSNSEFGNFTIIKTGHYSPDSGGGGSGEAGPVEESSNSSIASGGLEVTTGNTFQQNALSQNVENDITDQTVTVDAADPITPGFGTGLLVSDDHDKSWKEMLLWGAGILGSTILFGLVLLKQNISKNS